ncbi:response regulator [Thermomonas alba]|uniref:response regulator n=1 Tax=Thermomonas alba TaxID=2888525 RepID=UPI003F71BA75
MSIFDLFKRKRPQTRPTVTPPARPATGFTPTPAFQPAGDTHGEEDSLHAGPERRERDRRNARPGTRILVIDDSPTIVALLKRMLQQNHYEVLVAYDGESGLEIARREVPDLIFLDIVLPGIDGFSALRTLRRDPQTKDVPIIMMSGNAQATEQFYVQRIGADDFMKKPFSRPEVFSRIEALLDESGIPRHLPRGSTRTAPSVPAPA